MIAAVLVLLLALLLALRQSRKSRFAPPGPPGYPIIGNVLSMSQPKLWLVFAEWAKTYGPIMSLTVPSHRFIVLNTYEAASTLMARHSDRMQIPMAGDLVGWGRTTGFLRSGSATLRAHRRLVRIMLNLDVRAEQEQAGVRLVERFGFSSNARDCIQHAVVSLILNLIYGYEVKEDDDEYLAIVNRALAGLAESATPGAFLVDTIPFLHRIPSWFPGMNFKRKAKEWRECLEQMATIPFELAKSRNELETSRSYVSSLIETEPLELQKEIKWVAVSIYAGAVETTLATLDAFLLTMILNPDVQQRAQRELDEVLSEDTVTLNHRQYLPYMDAVCKEVYRFHTVVPTGIGHCAEKDDVYGGYCIRKGDVILANQWSMAHDPNVYRDPLQFDPERFVKRGERDPRDICFGFGTRTCPGRFFMDSTVFVLATSILSAFNVVSAKDKPPPTWGTVDGLICHVTPFDYLLVPRRASNECVP